MNRSQVASSSANTRRSNRIDSASRQAVSSMKSERFLPRTARRFVDQVALSLPGADVDCDVSSGCGFGIEEVLRHCWNPSDVHVVYLRLYTQHQHNIDPRRQRLKLAATAIFEEWGLDRYGSTASDAPEGR